MSATWATEYAANFKRDIFRDFCLSVSELEKQFQRYEKTRCLSFPSLSALLGETSNKGLLWSLKDTAHHFFKQEGHEQSIASRLEWIIGYLFHECLKITETAYQIQHYAPSLAGLQHKESEVTQAKMVTEKLDQSLTVLLRRTAGALHGQIAYARELIDLACSLFCHFLQGEGKNPALARLFFEQEERIQSVFRKRYPDLITAIYGECLQEGDYRSAAAKAALTAAHSLWEHGQAAHALSAVQKALSFTPNCPVSLALQKEIKQSV